MIEPFLRSQMEPVIRRYRRLLRRRGLAVCWGAGALLGFAFLLLYYLTGWSSALTLPFLGVAIGSATLLTWRRTQKWEPDFQQIARQIEQTHPDLRALVVTAVEQHPAREVIRHLVAISSAVCPLVAADAASPLNHPSVCTPRLARRPGVHARWKQQNRVPVHHAGSLPADLAHRQR